MRIRKIGGSVIGAEFTAAEKKAMDIEIKRQLAEINRKHELEVQAVLLWQMHIILGFGPARLKRFYDNLALGMKALSDNYENTELTDSFLCTAALKDYGIDIEKWNAELESEDK